MRTMAMMTLAAAFLAIVFPAQGQSIVNLPGVRASADTPGCAEPASGSSVALSWSCLNRAMSPAATSSPPLPADTDVREAPTNKLGLYSASGLQHRMGQNLGISAHPYRPAQPVYPSPLVPAR